MKEKKQPSKYLNGEESKYRLMRMRMLCVQKSKQDLFILVKLGELMHWTCVTLDSLISVHNIAHEHQLVCGFVSTEMSLDFFICYLIYLSIYLFLHLFSYLPQFIFLRCTGKACTNRLCYTRTSFQILKVFVTYLRLYQMNCSTINPNL